MILTADTITTEQLLGLFGELTCLPITRTNQQIHDLKFAANALGYTEIVEGVDCRIPHGMEAEYRRRGRTRCAEILTPGARSDPLPATNEESHRRHDHRCADPRAARIGQRSRGDRHLQRGARRASMLDMSLAAAPSIR